MIYFNDLTLRRGQQVLLENANASIGGGQKVGLVGKNGCGKSSLLSLFLSDNLCDGGEVKFPKEWRIAWVKQEIPAMEISALDYVILGDERYTTLRQALAHTQDGTEIARLNMELDNIDGWSIEARASALLHGLGFSQDQLSMPIQSFSGGWQMRLNLAQALLCPADLLLLDEPTNHLDLNAIIWLEVYLKQYKGTIILISHDRDFLDPLVNKIIHIENQQLNEYQGNYSRFEKERATRLEQQNALYRQQQQKITHLQSFINRFKAKASKAKQAQSRVKALEKMELISLAHVDNPFHFEFPAPDALPNPLLKIEQASAGYEEKYGEKLVLEKIKFNLVVGSRIGLLGKNGQGKSTLVKLLAGKLLPLRGVVELAKGVNVGYFAQHQLETLRGEECALWHLNQISPTIPEQELRNFLGGFAFSGDKVTQPVASFSGGEKARLVLALIVWQRPNLLLLDEPTNHLDLDMRQALTEALLGFQGAIVLVSHDRHLLRNTVDEFYLVDNRQAVPFDGDLEDYKHWLDNCSTSVPDNTKASPPNSGENFSDRKTQKRIEAELRQRLAPLRKQMDKLDKQLAEEQQHLQEINVQLAQSEIYQSENKEQLKTLLAEQVQVKNNLEKFEEEWFSLQEQIEQIQSGN